MQLLADAKLSGDITPATCPSRPPQRGSQDVLAPWQGRDDSWALVQAAQGGSADAFGRLYLRHRDEVFAFLLANLRNKAVAEDLASETFVRAFRSVGSLSYLGAQFSSWLLAIARNLSIDFSKSQRVRREVFTAGNYESAAAAANVETEVLDRDTAARLRSCVDRLPDDQRRCIWFRFLDDLSVAETAAVLGRSRDATRQLQLRALRNLAAVLRKQTVELTVDRIDLKPRGGSAAADATRVARRRPMEKEMPL